MKELRKRRGRHAGHVTEQRVEGRKIEKERERTSYQLRATRRGWQEADCASKRRRSTDPDSAASHWCRRDSVANRHDFVIRNTCQWYSGADVSLERQVAHCCNGRFCIHRPIPRKLQRGSSAVDLHVTRFVTAHIAAHVQVCFSLYSVLEFNSRDISGNYKLNKSFHYDIRRHSFTAHLIQNEHWKSK